MSQTLLTPEELSRKAVAILCRELGVAETARFLGGCRQARGNYTEERDALFAGKTVDDIAAEIEAWKAANPQVGVSARSKAAAEST